MSKTVVYTPTETNIYIYIWSCDCKQVLYNWEPGSARNVAIKAQAIFWAMPVWREVSSSEEEPVGGLSKSVLKYYVEIHPIIEGSIWTF